MTKKESDRIENFKKGHICHDKHADTMKSSITRWEANTGIGTVIMVECNLCHCKQNVTEFEVW